MIQVFYGVDVADDAQYAAYRAAMTPILEAHGGTFVLDVRVAEVLRPADRFNRLFAIRFPSAERRAAFLANPEYVAIRKRLFDPSTRGHVVLGEFEL